MSGGLQSDNYAIDWYAIKTRCRSRGDKKLLPRFPPDLIYNKVYQLQEEYATASLLNGICPASFKPQYWWLQRWLEDYGLSLKRPNRKYDVPRPVRKERLATFWLTLFCIRLFIFTVFGYDPVIDNFDQSPFHHNETGSQNKLTLNVRGAKVT